MRKMMLLCSLLLWAGTSWAEPITYNLTFRVDPEPGSFMEFYPKGTLYPFGGETYHGQFTVDDSILEHMGWGFQGGSLVRVRRLLLLPGQARRTLVSGVLTLT